MQLDVEAMFEYLNISAVKWFVGVLQWFIIKIKKLQQARIHLNDDFLDGFVFKTMWLVTWVVSNDGYLKRYPCLKENHYQDQPNNQKWMTF